MVKEYVQSVKKQFENYKQLTEKTFAQLEDRDLFWQFNDNCNSIAIIVNHISGNMKSCWTDFFSSDGEKEWRNRDSEFEQMINSREELITRWNEGWQC